MDRTTLLLIPEFTLKLTLYSAQGLLQGYKQFRYELEQELDDSPVVPIRSQSDANRVADSMRYQVEPSAPTDELEIDDHEPDLGSFSVSGWHGVTKRGTPNGE